MKYITDYNPNWISQFEHIANWLRKRLPSNCHVHHVGSTSIIGMPAKNIVDIEPIIGPKRQGDIPHSHASINKAKIVLGYKPNYDTSKGFMQVCDWYWNNFRN